MKILTLPKGGGKTRTLVQLMTENDSLVYVAVNHREVENAYHAAKRVVPDIDRERFQVADNTREYVQNRRMAFQDVELLIDELDSVVSVLLGGMMGARIFLATRSA
jgi:hypothetical protein